MRLRYPKIQTVYKRDPETKYRTLIEGEFSTPELAFLSESEWCFSEKINGTNIRIEWEPGREVPVQFGGRTDRAEIPAFLYSRLQEIFTEDNFSTAFDWDPGFWVMLFGEGYGAKIQKGGGNYISDGCGFILFDVVVDGIWLARESVEEIAQKLSVPSVPFLSCGNLTDLAESGRDGFPSPTAEHRCQAEGIVARPRIPLLDRKGTPIMAKIKYKDFSRTG